MKHILLMAAVCALTGAAGCTPRTAEPGLTWTVENIDSESGPASYRQTFILTGDLRGVERLAFNQFARGMELADDADTLIEIVPGYYAIGSPRFAAATGSDTIRFDIVTRGTFNSICYGPDGAHLVMSNGSTRGLKMDCMDLLSSPAGYSNATSDRMPYGDSFYTLNESLAGAQVGAYDAVPSFKEVQYLGTETTVDPAKAEYREGGDAQKEAYTITVADGKMIVEAPKAMWPALRRRIAATFGTGERTMPAAIVNDYPSLPYRGVMIDIARNFQPAAELHKILDLMADYGLNTLHFHAVDDEAWRLELTDLPELTAVGSRRGYTPGTDGSFLPQIFAGDGNPSTAGNTSNGYITRAEMISLLQHADSLGIRVIPEIESPGHARAAIEAMKYRAKTTGDTRYLLAESADVDTSRYTSAQNFHDNVMNPAFESTYRFMDAFADGIIDIYNEAGVELPAIHIGGDEVARGAWSGSPAVQALMKEKGLTTQEEVHSYFVQRVVDSYTKKGIKVSGWQEIALRHSPEYNEAVRPQVYSVNCWSTLPSHGQGGVVVDIAEAGFPVVLSNVNHFYLDMTYSYHPYERGLSWGGTTDEFAALNGYPAELCPVPGANLQGISGQVFAETIRSEANLERMLLPKMLGLAERAWNPDTTYTDAAFNAVVATHIPRWERDGYAYHLRQPGILLLDENTLGFNSPYAEAKMHYTLDGSNPTVESPVVPADGKVDISGITPRPTQARAILVTPAEQSVVSLYNIQ